MVSTRKVLVTVAWVLLISPACLGESKVALAATEDAKSNYDIDCYCKAVETTFDIGDLPCKRLQAADAAGFAGNSTPLVKLMFDFGIPTDRKSIKLLATHRENCNRDTIKLLLKSFYTLESTSPNTTAYDIECYSKAIERTFETKDLSYKMLKDADSSAVKGDFSNMVNLMINYGIPTDLKSIKLFSALRDDCNEDTIGDLLKTFYITESPPANKTAYDIDCYCEAIQKHFHILDFPCMRLKAADVAAFAGDKKKLTDLFIDFGIPTNRDNIKFLATLRAGCNEDNIKELLNTFYFNSYNKQLRTWARSLRRSGGRHRHSLH